MTQTIIALCGLPGAGKTHVGDLLAEVYDTESYSMGDAIRRHAPEGLDSAELGDWASQTREEDPKQIPRWTIEMIRGTHPEVVVIDGVRSPTDYEVLSKNHEFYLLRVIAPFRIRLKRLQNRGREGEEQFGTDELKARDRNEWENLGYKELTDMNPGFIDVPNKDDTLLKNRLADLANTWPMTVENHMLLLPPVGDNYRIR